MLGDRFEFTYPWYGGAIAGPLFCLVVESGELSLPKELAQVFASTVDVSAIAVGFLGTSVALLYTLKELPYFREISRASGFALLVGYLKKATLACFLLAGLSLSLLFLQSALSDRWWWLFVVSVWVWATVTTALLSHRVMHQFFGLLSDQREPLPQHEIEPGTRMKPVPPRDTTERK